MTQPVPLRPCPTCRRPVPGGDCPIHPRRRAAVRRRPDWRVRRATRELFRALLADGPRCAYCWVVPATTVDHVHPLSRVEVPRDARLPEYLPACRPCNTSKGQRLLVEWVATGRAPVGAVEVLKLCTRA